CNETTEVFEALSKYHLNTYENQTFVPDDLNFIGDHYDDSFILLTPEDNKWLFSDQFSEANPMCIQTNEFKLTLDNQAQWHLNELYKIIITQYQFTSFDTVCLFFITVILWLILRLS